MKYNNEKLNIIRYPLERGFYVEFSPVGDFYKVYLCNSEMKLNIVLMGIHKDCLQKSKDFDKTFESNFKHFDYKYYSEMFDTLSDCLADFNEVD